VAGGTALADERPVVVSRRARRVAAGSEFHLTGTSARCSESCGPTRFEQAIAARMPGTAVSPRASTPWMSPRSRLDPGDRRQATSA
jgi:hypothetical protein